jgi:hypothetical protein
MTDARNLIITLGQQLSDESNQAYNLWTWLPSYQAAQEQYGDFAANYTPTVGDIILEATLFLAYKHRVEAGDAEAYTSEEESFFSCPE